MSYDIHIKSGQNEFKEFLLKNGAQKDEHGLLTLLSDKIEVGFWIDGDSLGFNYARNHFNVFYAYAQLAKALKQVPEFEFYDPQSSLTFTGSDIGKITGEYVRKQAMMYARVSRSVHEQIRKKGGQAVGNSVFADYGSMNRMSNDLYYLDKFKPYCNKEYDAFFAKPMPLVNLKKGKYFVMYAWTDLIEQVFPKNLKIGLLTMYEWDHNNDELINKPMYFKFSDVVSVLPEPEIFKDKIFGERILYKIPKKKHHELWKKIKALRRYKVPEGYALDSRLGSFVSVL